MSEVEIKFDNKKVEKWFENINSGVNGAVEKHKDYVDSISAFVFRDIIEHFEQEKGPDGKWKKWSKMYEAHMRKIGKGGNKILQDTGRLRQSFKPTNRYVGKNGITWYNDAQTLDGRPYAYEHNEGIGRLPKRQFMWLSQKGMDKISAVTMAYVLGKKR